jgi:integrase
MKRALNWATGQGYIPFSPIAKMERPEGGTRTLTISPEEFAELLGKNRDVHFRDLLEFSWEAGGRPQEVKGLEARHVDWKRSLCVYHYLEAKKEKTRVIYLTDKALSMVRRLAKTNPEGKLFRNTRGEPWTANAVRCRFKRLEEKVGKRWTQ